MAAIAQKPPGWVLGSGNGHDGWHKIGCERAKNMSLSESLVDHVASLSMEWSCDQTQNCSAPAETEGGDFCDAGGGDRS